MQSSTSQQSESDDDAGTKTRWFPGQLTCDFVELLIKLGKLGALGHDVLPHEEGCHDGHGAPLIAGVQGILDEGLVQQNALIAQVEPPATCTTTLSALHQQSTDLKQILQVLCKKI